MHDPEVPIAFVALAMAPVFVWRSVKTNWLWRAISSYSLATATVAIPLGSIFLTREGFALSPFIGLLQRLFLAPLYSWMVVMTIRLFKIVRSTQSNSNE